MCHSGRIQDRLLPTQVQLYDIQIQPYAHLKSLMLQQPCRIGVLPEAARNEFNLGPPLLTTLKSVYLNSVKTKLSKTVKNSPKG